MQENLLTLINSTNLNSKEIAEKLQIEKSIVDKKLLEIYFAKHKKVSEQHPIFLQILDRLNQNPDLTYVQLAEEFNLSAKTISSRFISARVYIYRKSANVQHKFDEFIIEDMYKLFKSGMPKKAIGEKYNVSAMVVTNLLKNAGYSLDNCDITFFDEIDTEEKAYWLGFLYADGYISKTSEICVDLKILDVAHLIKFKRSLDANTAVRSDIRLQRARFSVKNKYLHMALNNLGCINNKSLVLTFPNENIFVNSDLIRHFIRGYFDGDGCLSFARNKYFTPRITILGTKDFLISLLKHIQKYLSIENLRFYKDKRHNEQIMSLIFTKDEGISFLNWIYSNCTIYLNRKYSRYLCFKNHNFAVLKSDFEENDRAISENAKLLVLKLFPNFIFKTDNIVDSEITEETKESSVS